MLPHKLNNSNYVLMVAYNTTNPLGKEKPQCRFMLFIRLRPGIPSHFANQSRTGYYPGNKYTDKEPEMLRNLLKMIDKRLSMYDRIELYDNQKSGEEKIIVKIVNDTIERNDLNLYTLMLAKYILPKWLAK